MLIKKGAGLERYRRLSHFYQQTRFPKAIKPPPESTSRIHSSLRPHNRLEGASGPPRPVLAPPPTSPSELRRKPGERLAWTNTPRMPNSRIWWRLPKGRFSSKDPRAQVGGERRGQVGLRCGALSPGLPARHPFGGKTEGAVPLAVSKTQLAGLGEGVCSAVSPRHVTVRGASGSHLPAGGRPRASGADAGAHGFGAERPSPRLAFLQGSSLPLAALASPAQGAGIVALALGFSAGLRSKLMTEMRRADFEGEWSLFSPEVKVGERAPFP